MTRLPARTSAQGAVYLAETTTDLRDEREALRRDLQQHGFRVLPDRPLPVEASDLAAAVRGYLSESRLLDPPGRPNLQLRARGQ